MDFKITMNNVSKKMLKKVKKGKKKNFWIQEMFGKKWKFLNNDTIREMAKQIKRIRMLT